MIINNDKGIGIGTETKSMVIDGIPPSTCIFCNKFTTSIYFDMDLHLYKIHRIELSKLALGKGFSIDSRIQYAIDEGKKVYEAMKAVNK